MKYGALILGVVVSALLLAAAGVLYTLSGNPSAQHYRTAIVLVREIQQLASSWSIEIARVKVDLLADFDSLTAFIPRMNSLKENLSNTSQRISGLPHRLDNSIRAYVSIIDAKQERIERFKTGYAVVRNSVRYLPLAAANAARQAREANDEALARTISMLTQNMNLYLSNPTGAVKSRLTADLQKLRENVGAYSPQLANSMANLVSHADVLLSRHGPVNELFQRATSNEVSDLADQLVESLEFELVKAGTLASHYKRGSMAVIGVLALFWVVLVLYQRSRRAAPETHDVDRESAPALTAPVSEPSIGDYELPHPAAFRDEFGDLPVRAIGHEAASESDARLSAETAMLYGFFAERVGDNITAFAERVAARIEHLRRTHERIYHALQNTEVVVELPGGTDLDAELEASSAIATHARREIRGIADLARRLASLREVSNGDADRGMVDINACIEEVVAATGADDVAEVSRRLGDVPEIFASRTEIRLLLAQVLDNSVHAVEGLEDRTGTIKIDTASHDEEIRITILDNGTGIAPDQRKRIFRPFYTSRDGAVGLGLTLAGHLVKKYEGGIKVNSMPGQGTVTRITLPTGIPAP